jgi:hypothetical protein
MMAVESESGVILSESLVKGTQAYDDEENLILSQGRQICRDHS